MSVPPGWPYSTKAKDQTVDVTRDAGCCGPGRKPRRNCGREVYALGLCTAHYTQQRRTQELAPLRDGPARVVISIRVSPDAAERVAKDRDGARDVIEKWAKRA